VPAFWAEHAASLDWFRKWDTVLEWNEPHAKWFVGGKINVSYNCLDRHLTDRGDKTAFIWEGEPGEQRTMTYEELHARIAKVLAFLDTLDRKAVDGAAGRDIVVPLRDRKLEFKGSDYLVGWALPNFYFHVTTTYAILRHNGVELGKKDFLGGT
jgi:hypothetical protein